MPSPTDHFAMEIRPKPYPWCNYSVWDNLEELALSTCWIYFYGIDSIDGIIYKVVPQLVNAKLRHIPWWSNMAIYTYSWGAPPNILTYPLVIKHGNGKSPFLTGKLTMIMFNSYVKLPEGSLGLSENGLGKWHVLFLMTIEWGKWWFIHMAFAVFPNKPKWMCPNIRYPPRIAAK